MIRNIIVVSSMIVLVNCSQSQIKDLTYDNKAHNSHKTRLKQTLPASGQFCNVIEYNNQSNYNILDIISVYGNHFVIDKNRMKDESADDILHEVVKKRCEKIAKDKGLKFAFDFDASRKTCICAYGDKK